MNIVLWILQVLLAAAFLAHGLLLLAPPPEIAAQMTASLPRWFWVFLGIAEVLAAIGLILPGLTGIMTSMVGWAAIGIVVVMISATIWHIARNESAVITLLLLAMATVVAYMRLRVLPIRQRRAV